MENQSYHVPFYVVNGGVATSGYSSDLATNQLGIFDRSTFSVATSAGSGKEFFFAQAPAGGKDWYGYPMTGSHKSAFFLGKDVEDMYVSLPQTLQNEEWVLGYNGAASSVGLSFEKGKAVRVKFLFTGDATYRFFGGPKEYTVSHTPMVDCVTPCTTGNCTDVIGDPIVDARALINSINTHVELQKFGVKAYLVSKGAIAETGSTVTGTKTFRITLNRHDDGSDRLADVNAVLATLNGTPTATKVAGEGCTDDYTFTLTSYPVAITTACLTNNVTFPYDTVPAIDNSAWVDTTPAPTEDDTRKVGIRVSAGYLDPKFGNCSFNPDDYYENMPIKFELSLLGEDDSRCDVAKWPSVLNTKKAQIARQTGEAVVRELIMKTDAYLQHIKQFSLEPRMREAFDMQLLNQVDRSAFYKLYYIRFKASYGNSFRKNEQEKFTAVFAIKSTDSATDSAFNTNIINVVAAKSTAVLHTNS